MDHGDELFESLLKAPTGNKGPDVRDHPERRSTERSTREDPIEGMHAPKREDREDTNGGTAWLLLIAPWTRLPPCPAARAGLSPVEAVRRATIAISLPAASTGNVEMKYAA